MFSKLLSQSLIASTKLLCTLEFMFVFPSLFPDCLFPNWRLEVEHLNTVCGKDEDSIWMKRGKYVEKLKQLRGLIFSQIDIDQHTKDIANYTHPQVRVKVHTLLFGGLPVCWVSSFSMKASFCFFFKCKGSDFQITTWLGSSRSTGSIGTVNIF